ncbi:pre-mRNA-splicing factor CWC22 homolog [Acropora millepora]|uniref:pre-mRNA-splicing factor CWC22 homolog n=1 Tax=Acropora millepora TaxID=45264 RepID=UPI001CF18C49|nr:pre-mRNA-splicing factor CWC22 homolog [Acropora millepora]
MVMVAKTRVEIHICANILICDYCSLRAFYIFGKSPNKWTGRSAVEENVEKGRSLWGKPNCIKLNEDDTTSSSRVFIKILFQELAEFLGLPKLNERLKDPFLAEYFEGIFPRDNPRNTRFSINFFTSIGLGGVTDELREHLKNAPKAIMAQQRPRASDSDSDSSDDSSSEESSSSDESSDSSEESSEDDRKERHRRKQAHMKKDTRKHKKKR